MDYPTDEAGNEAVVERLEVERDALIGELGGTCSHLDDLWSGLDVQLADVDYWAVEQAMEELPHIVDGAEGVLDDLVLLSRILEGDEAVGRTATLSTVADLDLDALFVDVDEEDEDPEIRIADARVGEVARHLLRCVMAVESSMTEAADMAASGCGGEATKAFDHARLLIGQASAAFRVWCETLEGVLALTGSYPGFAGEQVAAFTTWLHQNRS
jgi:hypothetical protein